MISYCVFLYKFIEKLKCFFLINFKNIFFLLCYGNVGNLYYLFIFVCKMSV